MIECIIKRVNLLFSAWKVCTPGGLSPTVVHVPTEKHKRQLIRWPSNKLLDIETTFWINWKCTWMWRAPRIILRTWSCTWRIVRMTRTYRDESSVNQSKEMVSADMNKCQYTWITCSYKEYYICTVQLTCHNLTCLPWKYFVSGCKLMTHHYRPLTIPELLYQCPFMGRLFSNSSCSLCPQSTA